MSKKGSNSNVSTSYSGPPAPVANSYYELMQRAQNVASTPYEAYGGEQVAPLTNEQWQGIGGVNNYANFATPYITGAAGYANALAQPLTQDQIQQYMNPYTQDVINATQADFNTSNAEQQSQLVGNAAAQNALGGDRVGVAQAQLAGQQARVQNPIIAKMRQDAYTQALGTAETQKRDTGSVAPILAGLGTAGQTAGLQGAGAQIGAGTLEQQTQQAQDTAAFQEYLRAQGFPYQQTQWLSGIETGVGSQLGGTNMTVAQGPQPNRLAQNIGLGLTGLGAAGSFMSGAAAIAPFLAAMASGGGVKGDKQQTLPESEDTLIAQQHQLRAGHRRAQMFPHGTRELSLPPGMKRTEAHNGVFHHDPRRISEEEIKKLSAANREHEILDLGPYSKEEIAHRVLHRGERPLAIVERDHRGTEVRSSAGTHATAHHQLAEMEKTKSPGHRLQIEDIRDVLHARRNSGGRVPGYAGGGATDPYGGVASYIPGIQITPGHGAPTSSAFPGGGKDGSSGKSGSGGIGDIGSGLSNLLKNSGIQGINMLPTDTPNNGSGIYTGPAWQPGFSSDPSGSAVNAMLPAGFDAGFAQGGFVTDDDQEFGIRMPRGYATDGAVEEDSTPTMAGYGTSSMVPDFGSRFGTWIPGVVGNKRGSIPANLGFIPPVEQQRLDQARMEQPGVATQPSGINMAALQAGNDEDEDGGGGADTGSDEEEGDTESPEGARPMQGEAPAGLRGEEQQGRGFLGLSPAASAGLMSAGLNMIAQARGSHPSSAIGVGAVAGYNEYRKEQERERKAYTERERLRLADERIKQAEKRAERSLDLREQGMKDTKAYREEMLKRENYKPTGISTDEGHPVLYDTRSRGPAIDAVTQKPITADTKLVNNKTPETTYTPEELNTMARQWMAGDKSVLQNVGRGVQGASDLRAIRKAIIAEMNKQGISPEAQAVKMAEFQGMAAGQRALGTRTANIEMAANEARNMIKPALDLSEKINRTQWTPVNRAIQAYETGSSDPEMAAWGAANFSLVNTYVRAIAPTGVPPESAREHALKMLNTAMDKEAYRRVLRQMDIEMDAALKSPEQVRDKFRQMYGGSSAAPPKEEKKEESNLYKKVKRRGKINSGPNKGKNIIEYEDGTQEIIQ